MLLTNVWCEKTHRSTFEITAAARLFWVFASECLGLDFCWLFVSIALTFGFSLSATISIELSESWSFTTEATCFSFLTMTATLLSNRSSRDGTAFRARGGTCSRRVLKAGPGAGATLSSAESTIWKYSSVLYYKYVHGLPLV